MKERAFVITYDRKSELSDLHLTLNKVFLNRTLLSTIRARKERVLYVPFPSKPIGAAIRIFVLSFAAKRGLSVLWVQKAPLNFFARCLLKFSRAEITALSSDSALYFQKMIGQKRVRYLKTGIDTEKFQPVCATRAKELKEKYGLDPTRPVVLHVGHLQSGRNIGQLLKLSKSLQILLVISPLFLDRQDLALRQQLSDAPNVRLIDSYLPEIQEIYQLSDLYFFPVLQSGNCIDVPLSCLEAAACNKPIVTTRYGEMKEFEGKQGFLFLDSFDTEHLNATVQKALELSEVDTRSSVLDYDWSHAINLLL